MSCTIPQNQLIYQALLNKAASYPSDKSYQAKAYNKAAEIIRTCNTDIYALVKKCNSKWDFDDDFEDEELDIGSSVASFIYEYAKENPLPTPTGSFVSATPPQRQTAIGSTPIGPLCKVPQNSPIYEALIKKANNYTDQDSYQAKAYYNAAQSVLSFEHDIVAGVSKYDDYWSMDNYVPGVGVKIAEYITSIVIGIKDKATAATAISTTNLETLRYNAKEAALNAREASLNAREMALNGREAMLNVRELQIKIKETEAAAAAMITAANATEKALTNA